MTKIEWTEQTWNPIVGCSVVSPGCTNCYAMNMADRLARMGTAPHYVGLTDKSRAGPVFNGKVALAPERVLTAPLRRKKPTVYFVNSMGDLFHENVPDEWIDRVFAIMALTPQHTYQVLTKRADRMREYVTRMFVEIDQWDRIDMAALKLGATADEAIAAGNQFDKPLPNVWLGVTAEDQTRADQRIPDLLATPAAVRFVSVEPMLGPVDLERWFHDEDCNGPNAPTFPGCFCRDYWPFEVTLDWVICGGESGGSARPMHPDWARSLRDQCAAAGVPFFFKQVGAWTAWQETGSPPYWRNSFTGHEEDRHGLFPSDWDADPNWNDGLTYVDEGRHVAFNRIGKKAAGRFLDGAQHDGRPEKKGET